MSYIKDIHFRDQKRKELAMKFLDGADEYAYGHYGLYDWHRNITSTDHINYKLPFFRSVEGKDHTLFIIDIDIFNIDNIEKNICYASVVVKYILDKFPNVKWFIKLSGSSFHLIQKHNKRINPNAFYHVLCEMFSDWTNEMEENYGDDVQPLRFFTKTFEYKGETFLAGIDMSLTDRTHIISGVYSEYSKEENIYNRPISIEELDNPEKILQSSHLHTLKLTDYDIPPFMFQGWLGIETEIESQDKTKEKIKKHKRTGSKHNKIPVTLVPKTEENEEHLKNMIQMIENTKWLCIKKAVKRARNEHGVFYERAPIARFLYWNYKKDVDIIAYFFYYYINDEVDNQPQNWSRMVNGLNWALFNKKGEEKSMDTWHSPNIVRNRLCSGNCSAPCKKPFTDERYLESIDNFSQVLRIIENVIDTKENTILKKTTRVGATSSTVLCALADKKNILVICPTNKIANDTFSDISKLAHEKGLFFSGAVIGANTKLCLKCMNEIVKIRDEFKTQPLIAIDKLPFLLREKCNGDDKVCKYFYDTYTNGVVINDKGIRTPVIESQIDPPRCAFSTIFHHINRYNVVFLTYDKVRVLIHQLYEGNTTEEIEDIINSLLSGFDVVLLDEVSRFINSPTTELTLFKQKRKLDDNYIETDEIITIKNILREIRHLPGSDRERWDNLLILKDRDLSSNLVNRVLEHIDEIFTKILGRYSPNTWGRIDNPVSKEIRREVKEKFHEWYAMFVEYAKKYNYFFKNILDIMELVSQPAEHWFITNIPRSREVTNVTIKIRPFYDNVIDFIRAVNDRNKQIIITDATMPYVRMDELFGIKFKDVNIGDPRKTCKLQSVIPDNKNIYPNQLLRTKDNNNIRERMCKFISNVCNEFGSENVMVVCQNRDIFYLVSKLIHDGSIQFTDNIKVTYYRSVETIGVASERRVMVTIGTPHPPKNSYIWMAEMLKKRGLFPDITRKELADNLLIRESGSALLQAIGRAKDPFVSETSVVFCFGMNYYTLKSSLEEFDVPMPHFIPIKKRSIEKSIQIGKIWKKEKIYTEEIIYDSLDEFKRIQRDKIKISELPIRLQSLSSIIYKLPSNFLHHYGLHFSRKHRIIKKIPKK